MLSPLTIRFLEDVKKLDLKFPVADISNKTGFAKGTVSEYLAGKKNPGDSFLKKFYSVYYPEMGITENMQSLYPVNEENTLLEEAAQAYKTALTTATEQTALLTRMSLMLEKEQERSLELQKRLFNLQDSTDQTKGNRRSA